MMNLAHPSYTGNASKLLLDHTEPFHKRDIFKVFILGHTLISNRKKVTFSFMKLPYLGLACLFYTTFHVRM